MNKDWVFLKTPQFWVSVIISILLAVATTFLGARVYYHSEITSLNQEIVDCRNSSVKIGFYGSNTNCVNTGSPGTACSGIVNN